MEFQSELFLFGVLYLRRWCPNLLDVGHFHRVKGDLSHKRPFISVMHSFLYTNLIQFIQFELGVIVVTILKTRKLWFSDCSHLHSVIELVQGKAGTFTLGRINAVATAS